MSVAAPVITGIGVVAPTGIGVTEHWTGTLAGICRLGPISTFDGSALPVKLAGEVSGFDETSWIDPRMRVQTDRWTWMNLAATQMALADAVLDPSVHDPYDLSVVTASASGGNVFGQREIHALWRDGPRAVSAYQSIGWFYAASSGQISIREQLKGACGVIVSDGAGGIDALAMAVRSIRRGSKAVAVGGTEAPLSPYALACQVSQPTLSTSSDPQLAYRPFSPEAGGYVPGEGGAMLIVEDAAFAAERGVPQIYAEVAGTASSHDAYDPVAAAPDHRQFARAVREAIERADCRPADIDVVFADGAGERTLDRLEATALREVLGPRQVPVTVPKTMTGRLYAGGAALDLAWAALAISTGTIPPTVNVDHRAAEDSGLDIVQESRPADLRYALVVARGSGGFNSAAVLRRAD